MSSSCVLDTSSWHQPIAFLSTFTCLLFCFLFEMMSKDYTQLWMWVSTYGCLCFFFLRKEWTKLILTHHWPQTFCIVRIGMIFESVNVFIILYFLCTKTLILYLVLKLHSHIVSFHSSCSCASCHDMCCPVGFFSYVESPAGQVSSCYCVCRSS